MKKTFLFFIGILFSLAAYSQMLKTDSLTASVSIKDSVYIPLAKNDSVWEALHDSVCLQFTNEYWISLKNQKESRRIAAGLTHAELEAIVADKMLSADDGTVSKAVGEVEDTDIIIQPKALIVPTSNLHPHVPTSHSVNKTYEVGEISYQSMVTPSGGMCINVPIEIYQSATGHNPSVSLVYNSQSGSGIAGYGWNIGGVSSVCAISKSVYYDGTTKGVVPTESQNAWALDGNRLISTGTNQYVTEQGNIKVTMAVTSSLIRFTAKYPNGSTAVFESSGTTGRFECPIKEMVDMYGSRIVYSHTKINNLYRLEYIDYGKQLEGRVSFTYKTRTDPSGMYVGGTAMKQNYLLDKVTVKFNANTLRTYTLGHAMSSDGVSRLMSVLCTSGNNLTLNPLFFYYGDNKQSHSYQKEEVQLLGVSTTEPLRAVRGRFDYWTEGDGLLIFSNKIHYIDYYKKGAWNSRSYNYIANGYTGNENIVIASALDSDYSINTTMKTGPGFVDIFSMDVDNQFEEEIVKVNNWHVNGPTERLTFEVYTLYMGGYYKKYTRTRDLNTALIYTVQGESDYSVRPKFYYTGDFNGDGKTEVLAVSTTDPAGFAASAMYYLFDLEGDRILSSGQTPFNFYVEFPKTGTHSQTPEAAANASHKLYTFDYDGDGKTDLLHVAGGATYVYTFNGSGFTQAGSYYGLTASDLANKDFMIGDFNGDGKMDLLLSPLLGTSKIWSMFFSNGAGSFVKKDLTITTKISDSQFFVLDIDGDGQTDLVEKFASSNLSFYFIRNGEYNESERLRSVGVFPTECIMVPANIQSRNNFSQVLAVGNSGKAYKVGYKRSTVKNNLVTGIISSFGVINKIAYGLLSEADGSLYSRGYTNTFPYQSFTGPLAVVAADETYVNGSKIDGNRYYYQDAVLHKQGLGFRGFRKFESYSTFRSDRYSKSEYDPQNYMVLKKTDTGQNTSTATYRITVAANKKLDIVPLQQINSDNINGNTTKTQYLAYDSYLNPTSMRIDYDSNNYDIISRTYTVANTTTHYITGILTEEKIEKYCGGSSVKYRTQFTYNSDYLLTGKKSFYNDNQMQRDEYAYNDQKLLITSVTSPYSSSNRQIERYTYDSFGRRATLTNRFSMVTSYEYNANGLLSRELGVNTDRSYTYTGFGRLKTTQGVREPYTSITYRWSTTTADGLYNTYTSTSAQPTETVYFDALGRDIRTSQTRFDGTSLKTDKQYDSYGRLWKVSLPYKASAAYWNTYTYDFYDRLLKINYASGKEDKWSYGTNQVTETKEAISSTRKYNARGQLTSATDPGGTITYTYRADGQLSAINYAQATTSFTYDIYGRQTSITDPSAGTETYTYDTAGNLVSVKNARNQTTTMSYDSRRNMTRKRTNEFSATYTYNNQNQLVSVVSDNGYSQTFTYDKFQLKTETETFEGKGLTKEYTYSNNRISSIHYSMPHSATTATESYTYQNGHLKRIMAGGQKIWELTAENAMGQSTAVTTGPLSRSYNYDLYGLPLGRQVRSNSGQTILSHYHIFDRNKGNLSYRTDLKRNKTENFEYDNLNRLTRIQQSGQTIGYNTIGNITGMTGVGLYTYRSSVQPYMISYLSPDTDSDLAQHGMDVYAAYTSFNRPDSIWSNTHSTSFVYNPEGKRIKSVETDLATGAQKTKYYFGDRYEMDDTSSQLFLGGDAYSAPAAFTDLDDGWFIDYICRDYLGSVCAITQADGNLIGEYSYDAWGRLRHPITHQVFDPGSEPRLVLGRGYCGHEYLPHYGLINMNARLYNPVIGRFLSPDPYVQAPEFTQSFNRYTYCLNNPLKYTDPSGEFFVVDSWIVGFFSGLFNENKSAWKEANHRAHMDVKLWGGLFVSDSNKNFGGRYGELLSRFSWQLPQQLTGFLTAHAHNTFGLRGGVESVDYLYGATAIKTRTSWGAVTLGNYIIGDKDIEANVENELFQHEYGHYIQSQKFGWYYLSRYGVPSALSKGEAKDHHKHPVEQDANIRAYQYFSKNVDGFYSEDEYGNPDTKWSFLANPILGYRRNLPYSHEKNQEIMANGLLRLGWHDYLFAPCVFTTGLLNALILNLKY